MIDKPSGNVLYTRDSLKIPQVDCDCACATDFIQHLVTVTADELLADSPDVEDDDGQAAPD